MLHASQSQIQHFSPAATFTAAVTLPVFVTAEQPEILLLKRRWGCILLLILHQWMNEFLNFSFHTTSMAHLSSDYMSCYIINIKSSIRRTLGRRGRSDGAWQSPLNADTQNLTSLNPHTHRKHHKQASTNTPVGLCRRYTHTHTAPKHTVCFQMYDEKQGSVRWV